MGVLGDQFGGAERADFCGFFPAHQLFFKRQGGSGEVAAPLPAEPAIHSAQISATFPAI